MKLKFISKLSVITAILAVLTFAFIYIAQPAEQWWYWGALIFYFAVGSIIGLRTQRAVLSESNSQFFTGVMGAIGIRMLLCIIFLAIYLMVSELKQKEFIVFYLFLYLFYTIFEISQLVSKLRPEKSSSLDNRTS